MTFPAYARLVNEKIIAELPDVTWKGRGRFATWTRGTETFVIDATDTKRWWVSFGRALVFDERQNVGSATVTAQNAIAHFT